jgi:hypothetical protein
MNFRGVFLRAFSCANADLLKVTVAYQRCLAIELHHSTETVYSVFRLLPSVCMCRQNRHKVCGSHSCVAEDSSLVGCYTVPRSVVTDASRRFCSRQHGITSQNT